MQYHDFKTHLEMFQLRFKNARVNMIMPFSTPEEALQMSWV